MDIYDKFVDYVMDEPYPEQNTIVGVRTDKDSLSRAKVLSDVTNEIINALHNYSNANGNSLISADLMFRAINLPLPEDFHYYVTDQLPYIDIDTYSDILSIADIDADLEFSSLQEEDIDVRIDVVEDDKPLDELSIVTITSSDGDIILQTDEKTLKRIINTYIPESSVDPEISGLDHIPEYTAEYSQFYKDLALSAYNYIHDGLERHTRLNPTFYNFIASKGVLFEAIASAQNNNLPYYASEYNYIDSRFSSSGNIYDLHYLYPNGGKIFIDAIYNYALFRMYYKYTERLLDSEKNFLYICLVPDEYVSFLPLNYIKDKLQIPSIERIGVESMTMNNIHLCTLSNYDIDNVNVLTNIMSQLLTL